MFSYIYIYIYTFKKNKNRSHTHTHTYIYIYIYILGFIVLFNSISTPNKLFTTKICSSLKVCNCTFLFGYNNLFAQSYDIKNSFLIQIICKQLYVIKHVYGIRIIIKLIYLTHRSNETLTNSTRES